MKVLKNIWQSITWQIKNNGIILKLKSFYLELERVDRNCEKIEGDLKKIEEGKARLEMEYNKLVEEYNERYGELEELYSELSEVYEKELAYSIDEIEEGEVEIDDALEDLYDKNSKAADRIYDAFRKCEIVKERMAEKKMEKVSFNLSQSGGHLDRQKTDSQPKKELEAQKQLFKQIKSQYDTFSENLEVEIRTDEEIVETWEKLKRFATDNKDSQAILKEIERFQMRLNKSNKNDTIANLIYKIKAKNFEFYIKRVGIGNFRIKL